MLKPGPRVRRSVRIAATEAGSPDGAQFDARPKPDCKHATADGVSHGAARCNVLCMAAARTLAFRRDGWGPRSASRSPSLRLSRADVVGCPSSRACGLRTPEGTLRLFPPPRPGHRGADELTSAPADTPDALGESSVPRDVLDVSGEDSSRARILAARYEGWPGDKASWLLQIAVGTDKPPLLPFWQVTSGLRILRREPCQVRPARGPRCYPLARPCRGKDAQLCRTPLESAPASAPPAPERPGQPASGKRGKSLGPRKSDGFEIEDPTAVFEPAKGTHRWLGGRRGAPMTADGSAVRGGVATAKTWFRWYPGPPGCCEHAVWRELLALTC